MYKKIVRPLLFRYSADHVHEITVKWAGKKAGSPFWNWLTKMTFDYQSPRLEQDILGLHFRNPVGLAAGFDKNGTFISLMASLGFGFCEVGSITAEPSTGNPVPRSFRLPADHSLINRMGLNNDGAETVMKRIQQLQCTIPVGINIAKTHNPDIVGEKALDDYQKSFLQTKNIADYITLNISCPNTPDGKTFESPDALESLLIRLEIGSDHSIPPVLVKLSSDLDSTLLAELVDVTRQFPISGFVAANTSVTRKGLVTEPYRIEQIGSGGLSGMAIREKSTTLIRRIHDLTNGDKLIIGVGGIFSAKDAIEKIKAGADLLQIYTGMIFQGPSLVKQINKGINSYLERENLAHIYEIRR